MKPTTLIKEWIELFNLGKAHELAELYHDDAINHQLANEPVIGKEAIKDTFTTEFKTADMTCIPENIFQDGEWVILEWCDPLGLRGCGFFKIVNGKIKVQRGYWDKLSFLRMNNLPLPAE